MLADDLQVVGLCLGFGVSVTPYHGRKIKISGRETAFKGKDGWIINFQFSTHAMLVSRELRLKDPRYKGGWSDQRYCGKVFCATMHTGVLLVRRNGKVMWTGNSDMQPMRGGSAGGQSKRVSGLEQSAYLAAGAYATQRENATLRGTRSDEYWRQVRAGETPAEPGEPFVWKKFQALLCGSGMFAKKLGKGRLRLGPMTDKILAQQNPVELKNGELVDLNNFEPISGGLFDPALVGGNRWGKIGLPKPLPNPAFQKSIMTLLSITKKEFDGILSGKVHLGPDGKVIKAAKE
jgi:hypothetical protein